MSDIGILDPKGNYLNPLTGKIYSEKYKELAPSWERLPAYSNPKKIISSLRKNKVTIVVSGTGSGKSVLIPKYLLHVFNYNEKVIITQPKTSMIKNNAPFNAMLLDVEIGEEVGYKFKGSDPKMVSSKTKLLFATDGTVVRMIMNCLEDPDKFEYSGVIVDEAHERSVQIDFLLYLLKNLLMVKPNFKVVIMSATINEKIFESYFEIFKPELINISTKPNYKIESIWESHPIPISDYVKKGFDIIKKIIKEDNIDADGPHDILFFVTSHAETLEVCNLINKTFANVYCGELYSGSIDQEYVISEFKYKDTGKTRKVVAATNVAEASITVDGLKFVIDSGLELKSYYDPKVNMKILDKQWISKAQVLQRMGRAGRTAPGICFHLYTKDMFETMKKYPDPSLATSNLTDEVLELLSLDMVKDVKSVRTILNNFIEPPTTDSVDYALIQLVKLDLADFDKITPLGEIVSEINMGSMIGKTLFTAYVHNCLIEVAMVVSLLDKSKGNIRGIFKPPTKSFDEKEYQKSMNNYNRVRLLFAHKTGDHVSLLKIMLLYGISEDKWKFTKDNYLKYNLLEDATANIDKIVRSVKHSTDVKPIKTNLTLIERVLFSFAYGFGFNHAYETKYNSYSTIFFKINNIKINKDSFLLYNNQLPKNIVFNELFKGSPRLAEFNIVSSIPAEVNTYLNNFV